jgi:hypothetical protein
MRLLLVAGTGLLITSLGMWLVALRTAVGWGWGLPSLLPGIAWLLQALVVRWAATGRDP